MNNKIFVIKDCDFELPEDFNGTCGEALMLLAEYRLKREEECNVFKISDNASLDEREKEKLLKEYQTKCILTYGFKEGKDYV